MNKKRTMISLAVAITIIMCNIQNVYATSTGGILKIPAIFKRESIPNTKVTGIFAANLEDITSQMNKLYKDVADQFNIPYTYVKALHIIAGGKAIYADKNPQVYTDVTVESLQAPFDIDGINTEYNKVAEFAYTQDTTIIRPNKHYLPDAAYNVTSDIVNIMNYRYTVDRGVMQSYFDALYPEVRMNVVFYEAIMKYCNYSEEQINNFYNMYEAIINEKDTDEFVVELNDSGVYKIKSKFIEIFNKYEIQNIDKLAIVMSFDDNLAKLNNTDDIKSKIPVPYKVDYTSRENMMIAALSVVGKVKYVWGGGHLGTSDINGINPIWQVFTEVYENNNKNNTCIKPSYSWCPIHNTTESSKNSCLDKDIIVTTVGQMIEERKGVYETTKSFLKLSLEKILSIFKKDDVTFERYDGSRLAVEPHRLEGLDCSGYTSWLYNQIDDSRIYDSGATYFVTTGGLTEIQYGGILKSGDVLSWGDHIVVIVGAIDDNKRGYVMVEASPNTIKLGTISYADASKETLELGKELARQANLVIGNITEERINEYNIDSIRYKEVLENDGNTITKEVLSIGRLSRPFEDESKIITKYNKTITEMSAKEVIEHTINMINEQYLFGVNSYNGGEYEIDIKYKNKEIISSYTINNSSDISDNILYNEGK